MSASMMHKGKREICPYNPAHSVDPLRMSYHLNKCRKNYSHIKMSICPFNATHHVREENLQFHLKECKDKHIVEKEMFFRNNPDIMNNKCSKSSKYEVLNINNSAGGNWNKGLNPASCNPLKSISDNEFSRNSLSKLGEGGRKFGREVDHEGIKRMPIIDVVPTVKRRDLGISNILKGVERKEESDPDLNGMNQRSPSRPHVKAFSKLRVPHVSREKMAAQTKKEIKQIDKDSIVENRLSDVDRETDISIGSRSCSSSSSQTGRQHYLDLLKIIRTKKSVVSKS